jgi:hypothetical protein
MPLFHILRRIPEATPEDLDAAALRSIVCAYEFSGLRWLHSAWDRERGELLCCYEAADAHQIEEHARRASIPCDEVREITLIRPTDYAHLAPDVVEAR